VSIRKIADELGVPFAFLTKVLQGLTQRGLFLSQRGASGGVALARPADTITLLDVLAAVGGDAVFGECVLGLPACSDTTPCALHHAWREQRARLEALFTQTTLAELVAGGRVPDLLDETADAGPTKGRRASHRRAT